jgi:hypothetical protein
MALRIEKAFGVKMDILLPVLIVWTSGGALSSPEFHGGPERRQ